jgi:hypothetical protein
MPFGMELGESLSLLVFAGIFSVLPFVVMIWAVFTLARIRSAQTEMLARLTAIEHRLAPRS